MVMLGRLKGEDARSNVEKMDHVQPASFRVPRNRVKASSSSTSSHACLSDRGVLSVLVAMKPHHMHVQWRMTVGVLHMDQRFSGRPERGSRATAGDHGEGHEDAGDHGEGHEDVLDFLVAGGRRGRPVRDLQCDGVHDGLGRRESRDRRRWAGELDDLGKLAGEVLREQRRDRLKSGGIRVPGGDDEGGAGSATGDQRERRLQNHPCVIASLSVVLEPLRVGKDGTTAYERIVRHMSNMYVLEFLEPPRGRPTQEASVLGASFLREVWFEERLLGRGFKRASGIERSSRAGTSGSTVKHARIELNGEGTIQGRHWCCSRKDKWNRLEEVPKRAAQHFDCTRGGSERLPTQEARR